MPTIDADSLQTLSVLFVAAAVTIGIFGTWLTGIVDQLADRTGLGEAIAGAVLLGASTSLSGAVLSVSAAWSGYAELAISNALGGIAVQTAFLAVADIVYRRANLEHAAASAPNMMQNALLIALLALILLAPYLPDYTLLGVHPVTPILFLTYLYGLKLIERVRSEPMWKPAQTRETRQDKPEAGSQLLRLSRLWTQFLILVAVLAAAGWTMEYSASHIAEKTFLSETAVGTFLTAISTSLPELVTSVAAVRRGALTLAVGGIIGGNAFDTLFTAASDLAYRDGSIYHVMSDQMKLWTALTVLMSAVLMMGLIRREEKGIARIGFESAAILALYLLGAVLVFASTLASGQ
ncbi:sodium:calcium antiporter [Marinobacteraceae bacterium S3BR75-40.1]